MPTIVHLELAQPLQCLIEGLTFPQISVRDGLMRDFGLSQVLATAVVKGEITAEEAVAIHCGSSTVTASQDVLCYID